MERTPQNIVKNILDVLNHETPESVILFGHSMGCLYALLAVEKTTQPIQHVYLMEPPHTGIKKELLEETEHLGKQYETVQIHREKGELTVDHFRQTINPLNSEKDKEKNLDIVLHSIANRAIISESKHTDLALEKMAEVEQQTFDVPLTLFVSKNREQEFLASNYADKAEILAFEGNHFLHWTNEEAILNQFDS